MNWFNTIVVVGIIIIISPALIGGGIAVAAFLVALWLLATFSGKIGLDIAKERQSGATAAKYKSRALERDDGQRWDR